MDIQEIQDAPREVAFPELVDLNDRESDPGALKKGFNLIESLLF